MLTIVEMAPTGEASQKTPAKVEFMAKAAVVGVDVAAVEEHLARYVVSCPLCKGMGQLGVAHEECKIISGADAKDGISVVVVLCKRCGYLMTLAADQILPSKSAAKAGAKAACPPSREGGRQEAAARNRCQAACFTRRESRSSRSS